MCYVKRWKTHLIQSYRKWLRWQESRAFKIYRQ